jgi:AcrR family transcriptional regulator
LSKPRSQRTIHDAVITFPDPQNWLLDKAARNHPLNSYAAVIFLTSPAIGGARDENLNHCVKCKMPKSKGRNETLFNTTHRGVYEAARAMFASEGYAAVATQRIAEVAGVSHGSVFHHFKSKRALFIAVHQGYEAAFLDRVEAAAAGAPDRWARFDRYWRAYIDAAREPDTRLVLLQDGPQVIGTADLCAPGRRTAFNCLAIEIDGLMQAGDLPRRPSRALALLIYGMLNVAAQEIADRPQDKALRQEFVDEIANFIAHLR